MPPLELLLQGNIQPPFMTGENIRITCQTYGSYPKAHIEWQKDEVLITAEERITDKGNITTSFIEFVAQPLDDKSIVECIAMNPDLPTEVLRRMFTIRVHYKPEVNIVIISDNSEVKESKSLVLLCRLRANPEPFKVLWFFRSKEIENDTSTVTLYNKLYIKNLTLAHSGNYSCSAKNIYGEARSSISVTVKHKPLCCKTEVSYSYRQETNDLNVTCNLSSYPSNVTFYWAMSNSSSNHSWSTGQVPHTLVELRNSASELLCWGRNEIGLQESPCKIVFEKEPDKSFLFLPVLTISIAVVVIVIIAVFIVVRKYKLTYDLSSIASSHHEMVQMKDSEGSNSVIEFMLFLSLYVTICYYITMKTHYYDNSCGKLISKCVKQASDSPENDCSSKLLQQITKFPDPMGRGLSQLD